MSLRTINFTRTYRPRAHPSLALSNLYFYRRAMSQKTLFQSIKEDHEEVRSTLPYH